MPAYKERFPPGSLVRIRDVDQLREFQASWKWHHPLEDDRIQFAGREVRVTSVGFYHGGDALYTLDRVPGTWHEACLESAE